MDLLLYTLFSLLFFLVLIVSLLCVLFYSVLRFKLLCHCEICESYVSFTWTKRFRNLCDWYAHLLKNSPTKTIHIHVLGNTITANPDNVEYILKTRFDNYPKGKRFSSILGDFLGRGIFNVDGDSWKFQRKMASLELDKQLIRSFAFEIVHYEIEERLIPLLRSKTNGVVLDLQDVFKRFSFDSICRFSFGLDPRCLEMSLPMSNFAVAFDLASKLSAERAMTVSPLIWKLKRKLNLGSEKRMREAIKIIDMVAQGVINQRREIGKISTHKDLLSRFMRSVTDDDTYLRDIVISFLLAGRDTVAAALTSLFWLLAKHPEVSSLIRAEADRVLGRHKTIKSFEQIRELHYLQAVIYESMRLYPPIQFDSKFCQNDDVLPDGTLVKRGTRVTYHPYAMGRVEEIWGSDCLEFKPERWLRDGVFFNENPFKYPVFQAGLRVCLGKEMALMELKTVALSLVQNFDLELTSPFDHVNSPCFSPGLTATFNGGLPVLVREREESTNV